ncbi:MULTISPECIES: helix-turn-helix domain-containing protein [unclassified Moraxella]|uniref:helix-turn-helix domain-containing protein n=1 Tax=unclassified Moraxella TaxID=2685852 RepID=UPI003AF9B1A3
MTANTPSPNDTTTHKRQLLAHLMTGKKLTTITALEHYQCFACSQRLGDLRRNGVPIQSQFIKLANGKRVKEYWLEPSYIQKEGQ